MNKIDKLLDAIEHPDCYSNSEIEAMLADQEVKEVYNLLNKTEASLTPISPPDINIEWESFERNHMKRKFRLFNTLSRNVAASIIIGLTSLAAVAAIVGIRVYNIFDVKAKQPVSVVVEAAKDDSVKIVENLEEKYNGTATETVVFDNESFECIINHIAEYYGYKVEYSTDSSKGLRLYFRWNQEHTLDDVVESLNNFEQISIRLKDKTIKID